MASGLVNGQTCIGLFGSLYSADQAEPLCILNPNEHRMKRENERVMYVINTKIRKKANINVKKLSSLKHCVRSQIIRLKLQKSFCDLQHGLLL